MYKTGHYGVALVVYAPVGFLLSNVDPALSVLCGVAAVSLTPIPDVDHRIPFVAHRGSTHTMLFLFFVSGVLAGFGWTMADIFGTNPAGTAVAGAIAGFVAIGSHLLADALTPGGVPLLWPVSKQRYAIGISSASNTIANYGLFAIGIGVTMAVAFVAGGR